MLCDFCLAECGELWGFSVGGFTERTYGITNIEGEWGICDDCQKALGARDLPALLDRVTRPGVERDLVERFYSLLILNITGPPVRFSAPDAVLYPENGATV